MFHNLKLLQRRVQAFSWSTKFIGITAANAVILYAPLRDAFSTQRDTLVNVTDVNTPVSAKISPTSQSLSSEYARALNPRISLLSQEILCKHVETHLRDPNNLVAKAAVTANLNGFVLHSELSSGATVAEAVAQATVPWPFRFSSLIPMNTFIAFSLLFNPSLGVLGALTPASRHLVWETYNRCFNLGFDYFNRGDTYAPNEEDAALQAAAKQEQAESYPLPLKLEDKLPATKSDADKDLGLNLHDAAGMCAGIFPTVITGYYLTKFAPIWFNQAAAPGMVGLVHRFASTSMPAIAALILGHAVDLCTSRWRSLVHGAVLFRRDEEDGSFKPVFVASSTDPTKVELMRSKEAGWAAYQTALVQKSQTATLVLLTGAISDGICRKMNVGGRVALLCKLAACSSSLFLAIPWTMSRAGSLWVPYQVQPDNDKKPSQTLYYFRGQ